MTQRDATTGCRKPSGGGGSLAAAAWRRRHSQPALTATAACCRRHTATAAAKLPRRRQAAAYKLLPPLPSRCRPAVSAVAIADSIALPLHPSCCCHRQHHSELAPQRFRRRQATATATTLPPLPPRCCHRCQAATITLPPPRWTYRHRRELDGGRGIGSGSIKGVARCGRCTMSSAEDLLGVIF